MATKFERDQQGPRDAEEAFSEASRQVNSGRSIEWVLAQYPEFANEFESLLRIEQAVRDVPRPMLSAYALDRITERGQAAVEERDAPEMVILPEPKVATPPVAEAPRRSWFAGLFSSRRSLALALSVLTLLVGMAVIVALVLPRGDGLTVTPLEQYSGIITKIEGNEWLIGDDTEVVIDAATEIHGEPAVGAEMSCIAERLPGPERYRALEVWIRSGPGTPTVVREDTSGWHIVEWYLSRL